MDCKKNYVMKKIFILPGLAAALVVFAGCSSERLAPASVGGDLDVVMSMQVAGSETRATQIGSEDGTPAENAINNGRLFFGTYETDGTGLKLKDALYEAGTSNAAVNAQFFIPSWGPSVAARLPRDDKDGKTGYKNGFYTAAFSVPAAMNATTTMSGLGDASFTTLAWPGSGNTAWAPGGNTDNNIPMAGIGVVSAQYLSDYYNETVYGETPLRLPDIHMLRAMAKIVIEDPDGIISEVSLKSLDKGSLVPDVETWKASLTSSSTTVRPVTASGAAEFTQVIDTPNGTGGRQFVFYTFERSFYNAAGTAVAGATDAVRKLITLKSTKVEPSEISIALAPYNDEGEIDTTKSIATADEGVWQGVMRNTVYIYRISRPAAGGIRIEVKPGSWINHKEYINF